MQARMRVPRSFILPPANVLRQLVAARDATQLATAAACGGAVREVAGRIAQAAPDLVDVAREAGHRVVVGRLRSADH